jgi:hypothetical protein
MTGYKRVTLLVSTELPKYIRPNLSKRKNTPSKKHEFLMLVYDYSIP